MPPPRWRGPSSAFAATKRSPAAVGADPDAAPGGEHFRNRRDPAAQLQIGAGTVNDVSGLSRQARNAVLIHPDAVRQGRTRPRNPNGIEVGDLIVSRFPFHELQL